MSLFEEFFPCKFQLEEDGEFYMIGSEIGNYLNLTRGALYKKFPSMWRRIATKEERNIISKIFPKNISACASSVTLLKANQVIELLSGTGSRFQRFTPTDANHRSTQISRSINLIPNIFPTFDCYKTMKSYKRLDNLSFPVSFSQSGKNIRTSHLTSYKVNQDDIDEYLVPIYLDITSDDRTLVDFFIWNLNETRISLEFFAELICDDFELPPQIFVPKILDSIKDQIKLYCLNYSHNQEESEESRFIINLDITDGVTTYRDKLEWDICDHRNDPFAFSRSIIKDLGLPCEFSSKISATIIAQVYDIRMMQVNDFKSTLPSVGNKPLRSRDERDLFTPTVSVSQKPVERFA